MNETIDTRRLVPKHQFGYIMPVLIGEFLHYNFYRLAGDDQVILCPAMTLRSFAPEGVEAAIPSFWPALDFLTERRVQRVTQGGIPISARLGKKRTLALIEEAQRRSGITCAADFEESIDALKALGAKRVAVAAKWEPTLMADVKSYLEQSGINVIGLTGDPHTATQVVALVPEAGHEIAMGLGRAAFREHPDADVLLMAGGAWQNLAAVIELEREFGRPVVTNPTASFWAWFKQMGFQTRRKGFGALLDSL